MDGVFFAVTVAALLFPIVVGWRQRTPLLSTALAALGMPVFTYLLYAQPFNGAVFLLLVAAGIAVGWFVYSKSAGWPLEWLHPTRSSRLIRVVWSALFLGVQASELWGSETQFEILLGLYVLVGAAWAGLLVGFLLKPRVQIAQDAVTAQPAPVPVLVPAGASTGWVPSHTVGDAGAATWASPDPTAAQLPALVAGLPVQVLEERGLWAHVMCSNGFTAWADSRALRR